MSGFAKLYGTDENQVLVMMDEAEKGPQIRVFFEPPGLGVSSVAIGFEGKGDNDAMWDAAEKAFNMITEESARAMVAKVSAQFIG